MMKKTFFCTFLLILIASASSPDENNLKQEAENGRNLVLNALNVILFGEPEEQSYQDLFLDTSKGLLDQTDGGNDMITIDDLFRIFFQSVIILSTSRRPDLIPEDFYIKNAAYGEFVKQLNSILDKLKDKGTDKVTIKDLRQIVKTVKSDEFWASIFQMKQQVDHKIESELIKQNEKNDEL